MMDIVVLPDSSWISMQQWYVFCRSSKVTNRGPAPFHRLTPNKRFEPVFSTVIMAVCSLFNRMLLLTDLIPVHLVYCGQTVMIGCNHTSFEWTRAVRHIYGIIRHMQGLYRIPETKMYLVRFTISRGPHFASTSLFWHPNKYHSTFSFPTHRFWSVPNRAGIKMPSKHTHILVWNNLRLKFRDGTHYFHHLCLVCSAVHTISMAGDHKYCRSMQT